MKHIALIDISGIQSYIYRSPRLREIASASAEIEKFSRRQDGLFWRGASPGATPIVAAGGNAAYIAADKEPLRSTIRTISRALAEHYPGLEAVSIIAEYAADGASLAEAYRKATRSLDERKQNQPRSAVTWYSGLIRDEPTVPPAFEKDGKGMAEPLDIDKIVCNGQEQTGLVAVVSVDGLGMGKKMIAWLNRAAAEKMPDERFCAEFRLWSELVKARWTNAWDDVRGRIADAFDCGNGPLVMEGHATKSIRLQRDDAVVWYPCRRIYQGGDDLVFVCDARLALSITISILESIGKSCGGGSVPNEFVDMHASAGILFIDSHFPFFRAASLADEVRSRAKSAAAIDGNGVSMVEWRLNRQGSLGNGEQDWRYESTSMRPYSYGSDSSDRLPIDWLANVAIPGLRKCYANQHNKLKDLLVAIEDRNPRESVQRLLTLRPIDGSGEQPFGFLAKTPVYASGFTPGGRTPIGDAAELYDIHYSLTPPDEADNGSHD